MMLQAALMVPLQRWKTRTVLSKCKNKATAKPELSGKDTKGQECKELFYHACYAVTKCYIHEILCVVYTKSELQHHSQTCCIFLFGPI